MHIDDIPTEVLEEIFSYLPLVEKFRLERVSRLWQQHIYMYVKTVAFKSFNQPFDEYCDPFLNQHNHVIRQGDWLPSAANENEEILESILLKCGQYLRSFTGFVNPAMMNIIAQHCPKLHCVNMVLYDMQSLRHLISAFSNQLTCATISANVRHDVQYFLSTCSNLTCFAVVETRRDVLYPPCPRPCSACDSIELLGPNPTSTDIPQVVASLRNIVIRPEPKSWLTTQHTLNTLMLFTHLDMISICLDHNLNTSSLWRSVMANWSGLRCLALEVNHDYCTHLEPIPPNLEYLSIINRGFHNGESFPCSGPTTLSTHLLKLKTLRIYKHVMTAEHLSKILPNVVYCCPVLEEFSLVYFKGLQGDKDGQLAPLLSLKSLKCLCLGEKFNISDTFASKLITSLDQLTSFGTTGCCTGNWYRMGEYAKDYMVPNGPQFLKSLKEKAVFLAAEKFTIVGNIQGTLHLQEPLPSNIYFNLTGSTIIKLSNRFGVTNLWLEWLNLCCHVELLTLEIHDINFHSVGLPQKVKSATIKCLNQFPGTCSDALTFTTVLTNLSHLSLYQQFMSNQQLQTTLESIGKCCPYVTHLFIDRGNEVFEYADDYVAPLFNYQWLSTLGFTGKFAISDECGAELVNRMPRLDGICSEDDQPLGIRCGPLCLTALSVKALRGTAMLLRGGPSRKEAQEMILPMEIPSKLHIGFRNSKL